MVINPEDCNMEVAAMIAQAVREFMEERRERELVAREQGEAEQDGQTPQAGIVMDASAARIVSS